MTDYHYVLDAPFESNKFFEKIEQDMDDNKLIFDKHRDHVVNEMISFNLKIKQYLDNLNAKFYINMNIHNINNLAGYINIDDINRFIYRFRDYEFIYRICSL